MLIKNLIEQIKPNFFIRLKCMKIKVMLLVFVCLQVLEQRHLHCFLKLIMTESVTCLRRRFYSCLKKMPSF